MATQKIGYSSASDSTALTITLASLATSASLVAGRESTVVDNATNLYLDCLVTGQVTVGTTPTTAKQIEVWVYAPLKIVSGTETYPVATSTALTGADAAATFEIDQKNQLKLGAVMNVIATSDRAYSFSFSLASLFGGIVPPTWGVFVTHNTGVNLNATAGNHWIHYVGITNTSA